MKILPLEELLICHQSLENRYKNRKLEQKNSFESFENPSFFFIERINGSLTFIGGSLWKCGGRFGNLAISLLLKLP